MRWVFGSPATAGVPLGAFVPMLPDLPRAAYPDRALHEAYHAFLALAGGAPLLVMDDGHALDELSALLVHQLASAGGVPVLVTARSGEPLPEPVADLWKDGALVRIELGPLDEAGVEALLAGPLPASGRLGELVQARLAAVAGPAREALELGGPRRTARARRPPRHPRRQAARGAGDGRVSASPDAASRCSAGRPRSWRASGAGEGPGLTERELEIARLVAAGLASRAVAESCTSRPAPSTTAWATSSPSSASPAAPTSPPPSPTSASNRPTPARRAPVLCTSSWNGRDRVSLTSWNGRGRVPLTSWNGSGSTPQVDWSNEHSRPERRTGVESPQATESGGHRKPERPDRNTRRRSR